MPSQHEEDHVTTPSNPIFHDRHEARKHLESIRWADGRVCPHCGEAGNSTAVEGKKHSHRDGLYYCNQCKGQFTVTVGTMFDCSKVPLDKWLLANHLICSSRGKITTREIESEIGVSYKTAWFMVRRIRDALAG